MYAFLNPGQIVRWKWCYVGQCEFQVGPSLKSQGWLMFFYVFSFI